MAHSKIEWTDATWNPVTGCNKISPGCKHCYAERMSIRLKGMGVEKYTNGFEVTLHPDTLYDPLTWKTPKLIFVNSMSDLFHEAVPNDFIYNVFKVMRQATWHQFQVLTKRSDRLARIESTIDWPDNVWMGVSVESEDYTFRIDHLRMTGAKTKFLSLEPLLGPLSDLQLDNINWVIVGGESGPGARPICEEWVLDIRDQCLTVNVPFFFKQWGGVQKKKTGRLLEGSTWNDFPTNAYASFVNL